jgi:hypothetical protein
MNSTIAAAGSCWHVGGRLEQGKSKRHIIGCLKRYVTREIFQALSR